MKSLYLLNVVSCLCVHWQFSVLACWVIYFVMTPSHLHVVQFGKLRDKGWEESGHAVRRAASVTDCTLVYVIHCSIDMGGFDVLLELHHKKTHSVYWQYESMNAHMQCTATEHSCLTDCTCALCCSWALLSHRLCACALRFYWILTSHRLHMCTVLLPNTLLSHRLHTFTALLPNTLLSHRLHKCTVLLPNTLLSHREADFKSVWCFWYKAWSKISSCPTYRPVRWPWYFVFHILPVCPLTEYKDTLTKCQLVRCSLCKEEIWLPDDHTVPVPVFHLMNFCMQNLM